MLKISQIALTGLICATMLAIGIGLVFPVSGAVGAVCDVLAVASGVFFVGMLDGQSPKTTAPSLATGLRSGPKAQGGLSLTRTS